MRLCLILILWLLFPVLVMTQETGISRCGSMERLQYKFEKNPLLKIRFESQRSEFNKAILDPRILQSQSMKIEGAVYTIPVVVHVVLSDQSLVTDAKIKAQLDTLNKDYAGSNADAAKIPFYFKELAGKSIIQFCLAQRTPDGQPSTGIDRVTTSRSNFSSVAETIKYTSQGGADSWDSKKYMNIWICALSGGILGYSSFPGEGVEAEQGVAIDYRSLPDGAYDSYNEGKTLTHETGHFFNLYHIWGDDNGACSGTDYVDDTPNQANSTSGCATGIKYDNCTATGNGVMYQNYMDYTSDACLIMFTLQQIQRMEAAAQTYYPELLSSDACQPVVILQNNVKLAAIESPSQRLCANSFTPSVTIKNMGSNTLNSLTITTAIGKSEPVIFNWTGSLDYYRSQTIALPEVRIEPGKYTLSFTISKPNNSADQDNADDTLSIQTQYFPPVSALSEDFEAAVFPSIGWDIVNDDRQLSWEKIDGVGASGNSSVVIRNFNSSAPSRDDLRLPELTLNQVDSAFLTFSVAAANVASIANRGNISDTLEVLLSQDCGKTYVSLYQKYGPALASSLSATGNEYAPSNSDWRRDSVNLGPYIGKGNFLIAFRCGGAAQNNMYLDDIHLRTVTINPNLKVKGFLATPNPARNQLTIQFYPPPTDLLGISLYSLNGQQLQELSLSNNRSSQYNMDVSAYPPGVYLLAVRFKDRIIQRKILKVN